ncbi:hypothetical protein, partial [Colwellia sp. BRX10-4]|uniref:hypothetical protein n=1 Tax=Colwellia sp. BRX10-4 TaxID=2759843 RepID=UPI001C715378
LFKQAWAFAFPCARFNPTCSVNSHKCSAVPTAPVNIPSKFVVSLSQLSSLLMVFILSPKFCF